MSTPNLNFGGQNKQDYYTKFVEHKDKMLDHALAKVDNIKKNAVQTGDVLDDHNKRLDELNNRVSGVNKKAEKTKLSMEAYLEKSSDCKMYIILAVQIFLFIILMSL